MKLLISDYYNTRDDKWIYDILAVVASFEAMVQWLYENKKGIHDIHMNQGSLPPYDTKDRAYSDGGIFFFNNETKKWTSLFIMFENQSLHTDENGKIKK